jgi:hypothetical protein
MVRTASMEYDVARWLSNGGAMLAATTCVLAGAVVLTAGSHDLPTTTREGIEYLTEATKRQLRGCIIKAADGTRLYTPDGKGNYAALWTRDFAYMVENAGDLMPGGDVEACVRYLINGIRGDGAAPDRVQADGRAVYVAGPAGRPLGQPNLDNAPFLVIAVDAYLRRIGPERRAALFKEWAPPLKRAMDYVPRSERGLIANDPDRPHSPYGFTDTVCKTGELFMESLLYWRGSRLMRGWLERMGAAADAQEYGGRAEVIERNIGVLWDDKAGMFLAATKDCRQTDLWGNAYAVAIDFPLGDKRRRIVSFLVDNYDRYVFRGQVRHLLKGEYWQRLLCPVAHDRYQNGAYWATASGWVMIAIAQERPNLARRMFADLISDFRARGICECITSEYRQLENYVDSATNPLAAARSLWGSDASK